MAANCKVANVGNRTSLCLDDGYLDSVEVRADRAYGYIQFTGYLLWRFALAE
jgi:hypothetical protein